MGRIERFEDVTAWQKARELTSVVYRCARRGEFAKDFGLKDQITRASVSIMNNIAEGFGRHNDKEFARFLEIAKGSACQVHSISYVALDQAYVNEVEHRQIYETADAALKLISGFAKYLRKI